MSGIGGILVFCVAEDNPHPAIFTTALRRSTSILHNGAEKTSDRIAKETFVIALMTLSANAISCRASLRFSQRHNRPPLAVNGQRRRPPPALGLRKSPLPCAFLTTPGKAILALAALEFPMHFFRRLSESLFAKNVATARRRKSVGLQVEVLEDRQVPSVSPHSGLVIPHVQVQSVYYGQDWTATANKTNANQLDAYLTDIAHSSYMSMLGEYGVGLGQFVGRDNVTGSTSPKKNDRVTEDNIQAMLTAEIKAGHLAQPGGNHLYIVYLPPNVSSDFDLNHDFLGHHRNFNMTTVTFSYIGGHLVPHFTITPVYYAVIPNPVGNPQHPDLTNFTTFQQQTEITSHELAEAVTNPDLNNGWWNDTTGDEIGDIVNAQTGFFDGYLVQKEWLNSMNAGFLPPSNDIPTAGTNLNYFSNVTSSVVNGRTLYQAQVGLNVYEMWQLSPGDYSGWFHKTVRLPIIAQYLQVPQLIPIPDPGPLKVINPITVTSLSPLQVSTVRQISMFGF
jgi:hypothetical protein